MKKRILLAIICSLSLLCLFSAPISAAPIKQVIATDDYFTSGGASGYECGLVQYRVNSARTQISTHIVLDNAEPNTDYYAEICILYVQPDGTLYHGASTYGYLTTNDKGVARDFAFQINDPYLPNVQFKLQTLIWAGSTPDEPPLTYSYRTEAVDAAFK
jgi:hypothetical protein